MKYWSEKLSKVFDTSAECVEAEKAYDKQVAEKEAKQKALSEERSSRAKKVEELYKEAIEAKKAYDEELSKFLRDYKTFHCTLSGVDPFFSFFDWF